jgi:hypothetical protein
MSNERMVYVAADPEQPGAAWAICSDDPDPKWKKELAKTLSAWVKQGATVMHVPHLQGCDMLEKWVRPTKPAKAQKQASLL